MTSGDIILDAQSPTSPTSNINYGKNKSQSMGNVKSDKTYNMGATKRTKSGTFNKTVSMKNGEDNLLPLAASICPSNVHKVSPRLVEVMCDKPEAPNRLTNKYRYSASSSDSIEYVDGKLTSHKERDC